MTATKSKPRTKPTKKPPRPTKYAWKDGARFPVSADVAGTELERIKKAAGDLTPAAVVETAADPDNPLHPCFDWDDSTAANKHRLYQARQLMYRLYVVRIEHETPKPDRPYFFSVKTEEQGRTYRTEVEIRGDAEAQASLLEEAKTVLKGFRLRYQHVKELAGVIAEIDKVTRG